MKIGCGVTSYILSTVFSFFCLSGCVLAKPEWELVQCSKVGDFKILIREKGIKADNLSSNYSIVSNFPYDTVYVFRDDRKVMTKIGYSRFLNQGIFTMTDRFSDLVSYKRTEIRQDMKSGFKYYRSFYSGSSKDKLQEIIIWAKGLKNKEEKYKQVSAELLVYTGISKDPKLQNIHSSIFGLPLEKGTPVKFIQKFDNGKSACPFLTRKLRLGNSSQITFSVPGNYKPVKDVQNVTLIYSSNDIDSIIKDAF